MKSCCYFTVFMIYTLIASACSSGDHEIILKRLYANNPGEKVQIINAESSFLRKSFVFRDESSADQDSIVIHNICLNGNTEYSMELSSSSGAAWAKDSSVILIYNQITLVNSRLNDADNGSKVIKFNLSVLLSTNNDWKYSTSVDAASWKESKIDEWGEDYINKEIKNNGITTYFRKDINVDDSFAVLQLSIQSQSGFIVYVNGIRVYTYLLPDYSDINSNVPSESLENISTYKQVLVPKELFASSSSFNTLKIAIELHTTVDHPELLSSFDVLTYSNHSTDYLSIMSPLSIGCSTSSLLSQSICNTILNENNKKPITIYSNHASFYISTISPLYINGYRLQLDKNNVLKEWKIFGSNEENNNNWILLDTASPITDVTLFKFSSISQQYKYYKFDMISSSSLFHIISIQLLLLPSSSISPARISRRLQDTKQYTLNTFEEIESIDFSSELSLTLSNCAISPKLPEGLILSSTCILSGKPLKITSLTRYSLSYKYLDNNQEYSDSINIQLKTICNSNSCSHIRINRVTTSQSEYEKVIIRSQDRNTIGILTQGDNNNKNYDYYGPIGIWSFQLIALDINTWYRDSYMIISILDTNTNTYLIISKMRTIIHVSETYSINTNFSFLMQSEWKYNIYNEKPLEWYGSSITDSTWSSTIASSSIPITSSNQFFVFRKTFINPFINNQNGFILNYKTLSNSKIYINEHEIAIYGFQEGYEESTDITTIITETTTAPISLFDNKQDIIISVLIYDNKHTIDISFDASLLIIADSNLPIYGEYGIIMKDGSINYDNHITDFDSFSVDSNRDYSNNNYQILTIKSKDGYKYISKYCITPAFDTNFKHSPSSWIVYSIDNSNNYHIHSQVSNAFSYINGPITKCYLLSNVTTGINTLFFNISSLVNNEITYCYINGINFYIDNITPETLPPLMTSSNPYKIYNNITLSIYFKNSEYYHDFTISPPLPDGITFDSNTGCIDGIYNGIIGYNYYKIQAISIFGILKEYPLVFQVQSCSTPQFLLNVQFNFDINADYIFTVSYDYGSIIYEKIFHHPQNQDTINLCLQPNSYSIWLVSDNYKIGTISYIYVNNKYYDELNLMNFALLFMNNYVDSSTMPITYSYANSNPPKHWNTNLFNDYLWSTVPSSSFLPNIPEDSITQYYRIHYTIEDIPIETYRFDITGATYAGIIIYINGIEINRVNIDHNIQPTYNTLATQEYNEYIPFISVVTFIMDSKLYIIGDNIIAIEIHKYNTIIQPNHGFNITINFFDTESLMLDGEWTVNADMTHMYDFNYLFDNHDDTYVSIPHECKDTLITYTFTNNTIMVPFDSYYISSRNDLSINYRPISFRIEASNDNWKTWVVIDDKDTHYDYGYDFEEIVSNLQSFTSYRLHILKCAQDLDYPIEEGHQYVMLNELHIYSQEHRIYCYLEGWNLALNNEYSYKICPKGYKSNLKRLCKGRYFEDAIGDDICIKENPSEFYIKDTNIILTKGQDYEQYYTMDAVDADITITPSLPDGILLDTTYQRLYGTPTIVSPTTVYTLSYRNKENIQISFTISITIEGTTCAADGEWPETEPFTNATVSCPIGYEGIKKRYCNEFKQWEEEKTDECVFIEILTCTGNTYNNGTHCKECINGIIITSEGINIDCIPCGENEYVENNICIPIIITCPATTVNSYDYPETEINKVAAVNCTNENQYGFYHVSCNYIENTPLWSNEINKDLCYIRPVPEIGKGLEVLEFSFELNTIVDDIYSLLVTMARSFIHTHAYKLTDLLLTTSYSSESTSSKSLRLHVYYGSNMNSYIASSSSHHESFITDIIITSTSSSIIESSSLINKQPFITDSIGYCINPFDSNKSIPLNYYDSTITNDNGYYHSEIYFCSQYKLDYIINPVRSYDIVPNPKYILEIIFNEIQGSRLNPNTLITLYRSIMSSIIIPINQLIIVNIQSTPNDKGILLLSYSISFPEEIIVNADTVNNYLNTILLNQKLHNHIPFHFSSIQMQIKMI
ncbi:hypothetical protein WA158_004121 [Blastocystis sp. Blastoise]